MWLPTSSRTLFSSLCWIWYFWSGPSFYHVGRSIRTLKKSKELASCGRGHFVHIHVISRIHRAIFCESCLFHRLHLLFLVLKCWNAGVPQCRRGGGQSRLLIFNPAMGGEEISICVWLLGWWQSDRFFGHHRCILRCSLLGLHFANDRYASPRCAVHLHAPANVQAWPAMFVMH